MINTLRIASVAAVVVAGLVLASVMGLASVKSFGTRDDEELNRILSAPSVVEQFKDSQGDRAQARQDAISPLEVEAKTFAGIIDPLPPPAAPDQGAPGPRIDERRVTLRDPSAKFDLLGTSYSAADPGESLAYIRLQDGKTYRWVRRGEEIGHLLIKEINRDLIVCWDGQKDVPISVPQLPDTSGLLEAAAAGTPGLPPSAADRITGGYRARPVVPSGPVGTAPKAPSSTPMTEEEQTAYEKLIEQIKESGARPEDREALVNKWLEEHRSSRVSPEEAEKVEDLGRELDGSRGVSPIQGRTGARRRLGSPR